MRARWLGYGGVGKGYYFVRGLEEMVVYWVKDRFIA